jgi:hypothetical protein
MIIHIPRRELQCGDPKPWYLVCNVSAALMRLIFPSFLLVRLKFGFVSSCRRTI